MIINRHWNRWIFASVCVYLKNIIDTTGTGLLKFVAEGQTESSMDTAELRYTGPIWCQSSGSMFLAEITLNFLIRCNKDEKDFHKIYRLVGIVEAAFGSCIPIKKYGNEAGVDDPTVTIGHLILANNSNDMDIETVHYGQLNVDIPLIESTVQAIYKAELQN